MESSYRPDHKQSVKDTRIPKTTPREVHTNSKAREYCTMVRPILEYASTVWNPYQINLEHDIEQVQRRAARFILNCYQDVSPGCVTRLLDKLQWEPLLFRGIKNRLVMAYKIQERLVEIEDSRFYTLGYTCTSGGQHTNKHLYISSFIQSNQEVECSIRLDDISSHIG